MAALDKLLYLLPVLGCAVMMGLMVWTMRGNHGRQPTAAQPDPLRAISALRAEIADLRARQHEPVDWHGPRLRS